MTTRQDLITLLNDELDAETLILPPEEPEETPQPAKYEVTDYTSPPEIEKYCLLNHIDVLFTVARRVAQTSRIIQQVPHTEKTDWEIGVWCIFKENRKKPAYRRLRDAAVAEVQRIFRSNPDYGTEKASQDDDYTRAACTVYNSTVTLVKKTYS